MFLDFIPQILDASLLIPTDSINSPSAVFFKIKETINTTKIATKIEVGDSSSV